MVQKIDIKYRDYATSEQLNKRYEDLTGPTAIKGFRMKKGTGNYDISLVRGNHPSNVAILPSGTRVEETSDLIDIVTLSPNNEDVARVDHLYLAFDNSYLTDEEATFELIEGSFSNGEAVVPDNPNPQTHLFLGYIQVPSGGYPLSEDDIRPIPLQSRMYEGEFPPPGISAGRIWIDTSKRDIGEDPLASIVDLIGDLNNLTTIEKATVVSAINEINGNVGNIDAVLGDTQNLNSDITNYISGLSQDLQIVSSTVDGIDASVGYIEEALGDTQYLGTDITKYISELSNDLNDVSNDIGPLTDLTTDQKSSIVDALNSNYSKIESDVESARSSLAYDINELDLTIGALVNLKTESKIRVVTAINEVFDMVNLFYVDSNVVIGSNAEVRSDSDAEAQGSIAIGLGAKAITSGLHPTGGAIAVGRNAQANYESSIAIGENSQSTQNSAALGFGSHANGIFGLALGYNSDAGHADSSAIGVNATALSSREGVIGISNDDVPGSAGSTSWRIPGDFSVAGTKNFEIPHPKPEKKDTHVIRHGSVESPTAGDTLSRFNVIASQDNETVELNMPDYFEFLNKDIEVWTNGVDHFGSSYANVENGVLKVTCEKAGEYRCLVIGTRNDDHSSIQNWSFKGVEREVGENWDGTVRSIEFNEIIEEDEIEEV